ncbi:hypothetical protein DdX_16394 [Ditylenchus destructor]|uniref:F-box domain-containing protein n=1 Tax=Ditylenchus destructor TaxID=166010 RepID=A0AAD4MPN6_9BILA|nr:hypothetical protein DdX_16394 [Ditylenchus destructor]
MSHPPSEVLSVITNFLPNDDITDLMLMSKTFNAHVTPRLRKIDEEMSIVNQSIESFMPSPPPETDDEWISQLNLKQFEPIGSVAKRRVKQLFADCQFVRKFDEIGTRMELDVRTLDRLKKAMSLERFDNETYLRILFALEMSTMNQSIKSFMPSPAPEPTDNEWISQLDLKKFLPIGSEAKKRMKNFLDNNAVVRICLRNLDHRDVRYTILPNLKEGMSLERFDDASFLRILGALIAQPEFRQEYNIPPTLRRTAHLCYVKLDRRPGRWRRYPAGQSELESDTHSNNPYFPRKDQQAILGTSPIESENRTTGSA